jgi:hypothetical protein
MESKKKEVILERQFIFFDLILNSLKSPTSKIKKPEKEKK